MLTFCWTMCGRWIRCKKGKHGHQSACLAAASSTCCMCTRVSSSRIWGWSSCAATTRPRLSKRVMTSVSRLWTTWPSPNRSFSWGLRSHICSRWSIRLLWINTQSLIRVRFNLRSWSIMRPRSSSKLIIQYCLECTTDIRLTWEYFTLWSALT